MPRRVNYTQFGKKVEKALIDRDMDKKDLAEAIGISQPYLTDILKGTRNGGIRKKQIADLLEIDAAI